MAGLSPAEDHMNAMEGRDARLPPLEGAQVLCAMLEWANAVAA